MRFLPREDAFDPNAWDENVKYLNEENPLSFGQRQVVPFDVVGVGFKDKKIVLRRFRRGGYYPGIKKIIVDSDGLINPRSPTFRGDAIFIGGRFTFDLSLNFNLGINGLKLFKPGRIDT